MASSVTSSTSTTYANLATTFQTAIKTSMDAAREPVNRLETERDTVEVRRGIYTDIKNGLDGLLKSIQALNSTSDDYAFKQVSKATVTPSTPNSTVFTATATESALIADYEIAVTRLAKAHTRASAEMTSPDMPLGRSGVFWMGGTGEASVSLTPSGALQGAVLSSVAEDQRELGTGNYSVEVRQVGGVKQFRLVDADGKAMSIARASGTGFTSDWQSLKSGTFDTGRGLTFTLDREASAGVTGLSYTAKGVSINISSSDTLRTVAVNINAALQPEGRDFKASVVGSQLVLTGASTGANHAMVFSDSSNLFSFGADLQTAQNAEFTVNGITISRASNSGITDVMDGVTLNLAGDAEGKSARLSVAGDMGKAKGLVEDLVKKFNDAFGLITNKMAITSKTEGEKTTYTRGPLTGDVVFRGLRRDMLEIMSSQYSNSGALRMLEDIGISFDDSLKLKLDASKFEEAYSSDPSSVTALLDAAMGRFENSITGYAGSDGSLQKNITTLDGQLEQFDQRISRYNSSLAMRESALVKYYTQMQVQLAELGSQAQMFGIDLEY